MVTHNPLHRSRRAALPHRALALGDDAEASPRIRVANMRGRKPAVRVANEPLHREAMLLAAAAKCPEPQPPHGATKGDESPTVQRHAEVADVPHYDRAQIRALLRDGLVHASPKLQLQFGELGLHALSHRLSKHDELSVPRLARTVGEAEEVEGVGLRTPIVVTVLLGLAAEGDQEGLVGL